MQLKHRWVIENGDLIILSSQRPEERQLSRYVRRCDDIAPSLCIPPRYHRSP